MKKIFKFLGFFCIGSWLGLILMVWGIACYCTIIFAPIGKRLMKSAIGVWQYFIN